MLSFRDMPKSRYRNIEKAQPDRTRKSSYAEKNAAFPQEEEEIKADQTDRSHIDQLIVTGRGFEAVKAVASVKDRVDENTSICLLNDGLGVLERVREEIFSGTHSEPNFYLGHMTHALRFNRNRGSVKQLKAGRTVLTKADAVLEAARDATVDQPNLMQSLKDVKLLKASLSTYEQWLQFKLPAMMFTAAVEPVCVLLDIPYSGMLTNRSAQKMMNNLLDEMVVVTESLPEVQSSAELLAFLRGQGFKKYCYRRITGKANAPSDLLTRIDKGLQTDINYQNGYFLRRANVLGIHTPTNELMVQMVKARRIEAAEKRRAIIPLEEDSASSIRQRIRRMSRA